MEGRGSVDSPADGEERGLNSGISNSLSEAIEEEQTEMASICRALSGDGALTLMIGLSASLVGLSCGFVELGSGGEGELDEDVLWSSGWSPDLDEGEDDELLSTGLLSTSLFWTGLFFGVFGGGGGRGGLRGLVRGGAAT
jgi:hypothetical protein